MNFEKFAANLKKQAEIKKKEQDEKIKEKALKSPKIILVGNAK